MKVRVLAAAAVAVWSKTAAATTATVLPGIVERPASASVGNTASAASASTGNAASAAATSSCTPSWNLGLDPSGRDVEVNYKNCVPGTLSLQASSDGTHWKTLASEHETVLSAQWVPHACLPGTWSYQGHFVADDHSFKGDSPTSQFTC